MPHNWTTHEFLKDFQVPSPGELVQMRYRYPVDQNDTLGPRSDASISTSGIPGGLQAPPKINAFHYALVVKAISSPTGAIIVTFYPIVSYTKPPVRYSGRIEDWNADEWLRSQQDRILLRHLPVPANGWDPLVPSIWGSKPLDFGQWQNSRPSWLTSLVKVTTIQPGMHKLSQWKRLDPPIVLSSTDFSKVLTYDADVQIHLSYLQSSIVTNQVYMPTYDSVWADIFVGPPPVCCDYDDDQSSCESLDPVTLWRSGALHEDFREIAREIDRKFDREQSEAKVRQWMSNDANYHEEYEDGLV